MSPGWLARERVIGAITMRLGSGRLPRVKVSNKVVVIGGAFPGLKMGLGGIAGDDDLAKRRTAFDAGMGFAQRCGVERREDVGDGAAQPTAIDFIRHKIEQMVLCDHIRRLVH